MVVPLVGKEAAKLVTVLQLPPEALSTSREELDVLAPRTQKLTLVGLDRAGVWTASPVASIFSAGEAVP